MLFSQNSPPISFLEPKGTRTDKEKIFMDVRSEMLDQFNEEILGKVLDSIESNAAQVQLLAKPNCPFLDLILNLICYSSRP